MPPYSRCYRIVRSSSPSDVAVRVALPYTLGTHDFVARDVQGTVKVGSDPLRVIGGRLSVPIASLDAGKKTLECHMREALGLDYARSHFPAAHVCENDKLPISGGDAVVFPDIVFELTGSRILDEKGNAVRLEVFGHWTIHGVSRDDKLDVRVSVASGTLAHPTSLRVDGDARIRLPDYGVRVKPALFIRAGDEARLHFNLVLAETQ